MSPLALPQLSTVARTAGVDALLAANAPVAAGVSGGKDGSFVVLLLDEYLDSIGHTGPRLLVHSHLGQEVEWEDSLPACERLRDIVGWELVVLHRKAGGLMQRWEKRWQNNVARYASLSCVKLILPWSTPKMRFCTSEMKTDVICAYLRKRFPGQAILSVTGVRHDESTERAKAPVAKCQPKLCRAGVAGVDWHPGIHYLTGEVFSNLANRRFPMHEAYGTYGSSRVSCKFCIMSKEDDLRASAACPTNAEGYRLLVGLEIRSTFSFQGGKWLGDIAPHLLTEEMREGLARAKVAAASREGVERQIPKHLLYTKGWPHCVPTWQEARLLADVRRTVAGTVGLVIDFTDPVSIVGRYQSLMDAKPKTKG